MSARLEAPPRNGVAQVAVSLIVLDGAPPASALVDELRREVVEVALAGSIAIDGPAPERPVVLVWAPPQLAESLLARVVAWTATRQPRAGLIGCAPGGGNADSERALAAGFDDFVAGAFSAREMAARLRALHRRVHWTGVRRNARLRFGAMMLDTDGHELWLEGRTVTLTGTELAVLRALMRARGGALTRTELLDHAWGDGHLEISERAVDNVILRLRRKLGRPELIQTVRGVGFRLAGD